MKTNIENIDKQLTQLKTNINEGHYGGASLLLKDALYELDILKAKVNGLVIEGKPTLNLPVVNVLLPSDADIVKATKEFEDIVKGKRAKKNVIFGFANGAEFVKMFIRKGNKR